MNVEDLLLDVFSYLSKNETEKCELISSRWNCVAKKGVQHGILAQERIFSKLFMSDKRYEVCLKGSCGSFIDEMTKNKNAKMFQVP
jgi:hypothetical protein